MYKHQWLALDPKKRSELAGKYGFTKNPEKVEVLNNSVVSDGYSDQDIALIPESELAFSDGTTPTGNSNPNERDENPLDSRERNTAVTNKEGEPGDVATIQTQDLGADREAQSRQVAEGNAEAASPEEKPSRIGRIFGK
jgi:hypothetical protein